MAAEPPSTGAVAASTADGARGGRESRLQNVVGGPSEGCQSRQPGQGPGYQKGHRRQPPRTRIERITAGTVIPRDRTESEDPGTEPVGTGTPQAGGSDAAASASVVSTPATETLDRHAANRAERGDWRSGEPSHALFAEVGVTLVELVYEMVIRDQIRVDAPVRRAGDLQHVDVGVARSKRNLHWKETGNCGPGALLWSAAEQWALSTAGSVVSGCRARRERCHRRAALRSDVPRRPSSLGWYRRQIESGLLCSRRKVGWLGEEITSVVRRCLKCTPARSSLAVSKVKTAVRSRRGPPVACCA